MHVDAGKMRAIGAAVGRNVGMTVEHQRGILS